MNILARYLNVNSFVIVALLAALLEGLVLSRTAQGYNWKSYAVSIADRLLAATHLLAFSAGAPVLAFLYAHRLLHFQLAAVWQFGVLFLGVEFCYYWFHRASHRVRWFWANHSVHHSPNEFNLGVAYRLGITGAVAGTLLFYSPMAILGFDPLVVGTVLSLNIFYQLWIHATWIPKLGPLEYVLNTPSHHRVHHARQVEYLDANYGGTLIIFDRLFGTFIEERVDLPCEYGLVKRLTSYNPIYVEFHVWWAMVRDVASSRSLREVVGYVFGAPGWAPDGKGQTTADLRAAAGLPHNLGM